MFTSGNWSKIRYAFVGLMVFIIGFLITVGARAYEGLYLLTLPGAVSGSEAVLEISLKVALAVVPIVFILSLHHEKLVDFGIALGKMPIRHLSIGAAVACVWLILSDSVYIMILGSSVISFVPLNALLGGSWLFSFIFLLTLNSFGEEIESRAYLQTVFSRATGIRRGIIISAVLFGMGHIPINIYVYHSSLETTVSNVAGAAMFGLAAGYLYFITGNILASISLHSVLNVLQGSLPLQISIPTDLPYTSLAILSLGDVIILFIILTLLILLHKFRPTWFREIEEEK